MADAEWDAYINKMESMLHSIRNSFFQAQNSAVAFANMSTQIHIKHEHFISIAHTSKRHSHFSTHLHCDCPQQVMNDANCLANKIKHTRKAPQHVKLKTPQHFKLEAGIVCSNCHVILNENGPGCPRQQKKVCCNACCRACCLQSSEKTRRDGSEESETRRKILKMGVGARGSKKRCAAMPAAEPAASRASIRFDKILKRLVAT